MLIRKRALDKNEECFFHSIDLHNANAGMHAVLKIIENVRLMEKDPSPRS